MVGQVSMTVHNSAAVSVKSFWNELPISDKNPLFSESFPQFRIERAARNPRKFAVRREPLWIEMSCTGDRKETFPASVENREQLARAGFFLNDNEAICFWCDLVCKDVKSVNRETHMEAAPWCPFARAIVGRSPTAKEREKAIRRLMSDQFPSAMTDAGVSRDLMWDAMVRVFDGKHLSPEIGELSCLLAAIQADNFVAKEAEKPGNACKVCLVNQLSVVFLQCGHVCCCVPCSRGLDKCPVCRTHVLARHVYKMIE